MAIPKTLVFHDSKQDATNAATFIDEQLPPLLRNQGIVKHYHSDMSVDYLQQTFEDFSQPDGTCCILHATAGAATGLDIRGVAIVIQYGICQNMSEAAQRAGRAARDPSSHGLFLMMVEQWAIDLPLENLKILNDPDRPCAGILKKNSTKQDRTSVASLHFAQSQTCLREFFAIYLDDRSPQHFTGPWCCDRDNDPSFNLSYFFHGKIYTGIGPDDDDNETNSKTTKRKRIRTRAVGERQHLLDLLMKWRAEAHIDDPTSSITWIINDANLNVLCKAHPSNLTSLQDLVSLLGESQDWANEYGTAIIDIINHFNAQHVASDENIVEGEPPCRARDKRPSKRAKRVTFAPIQTPESFATKMCV